jgi:DNA-binding transcriptional LysR family regulator
MELRHLKYFIVLAEELHFRRAAERLGIAQPPLSKQIRDLELELEVKLFERNQQRVLLTKAGKVFLKEARKVLDQVDIAVTRVQQAHQGGGAKISIGFSASAIQVLEKVLAVLPDFTPEVQISLQELNSLEQLTALRSNYIDLALGYLPDETSAQRDGLSTKALQLEKLYLAVSEQFPGLSGTVNQQIHSVDLATSTPKKEDQDQFRTNRQQKNQSPTPQSDELDLPVINSIHRANQGEKIITDTELILSLNILNNHKFILAQKQWGDFAEIRLREVLNQMNIYPSQIQEVSTTEAALSLVSQNLGITIISSAFYSFKKAGVHYVNMEETLIGKKIGLIWRKDTNLDTLQKIVSSIEAEIGKKV